MQTPEFKKSIALLSNPISILTILVLLVNDHYLRLHFPSWLTGKIGDFAWLYFSPFALAAIVSLFFPSSSRAKRIIIPVISFGSVLLVFILANTSPLFNRSLVQFISNLLNIQFGITIDPTDLIAIPSSGLALLQWINFKPNENKAYYPAFFLISLSTLLTIANSGYPDYGIVCLEADNERILAGTSSWNVFESEDGGLTWQKIESQDSFQCNPGSAKTKDKLILNNGEGIGEVIYKINKYGQFEYTRNYGGNWHQSNNIPPMNQAEIAFSNRNNYFFYTPGPFSGVIDPNTGNSIIAMGVEGVLVHTPSDNWLSVPIDQYQRTSLTFGNIPSLIIFEIELALTFFILVLISPYLLYKSISWHKVLLALLFIACAVILLYFKPALNAINYGAAIIAPSVFLLLITTLIFGSTIFIMNWQAINDDLLKFSILGFIGFLIFILPFIFWGMNIISSYNVSTVIALLFSLLHLIWSLTFWGRRFNKRFSAIFKSNKKSG